MTLESVVPFEAPKFFRRHLGVSPKNFPINSFGKWMKFRGKSWRLLIFFTRTGTHINTYKVLPPISSWFLIHSRLCGRYSPAWHSRQSGAPNETHPGLKPPMATFQDQQNLATKINIKICGWIKQLPIFLTIISTYFVGNVSPFPPFHPWGWGRSMFGAVNLSVFVHTCKPNVSIHTLGACYG